MPIFQLQNLDYVVLFWYSIYNWHQSPILGENTLLWRTPFKFQTKPQRLNLTGKLHDKIKADVSDQATTTL